MNEKDKKENAIAASDFDFTVQDSKKDEAKAKPAEPTKFASISEKIAQNEAKKKAAEAQSLAEAAPAPAAQPTPAPAAPTQSLIAKMKAKAAAKLAASKADD